MTYKFKFYESIKFTKSLATSKAGLALNWRKAPCKACQRAGTPMGPRPQSLASMEPGGSESRLAGKRT